jgi:tetratricopeptide (TPR) repeat protein
MIKLPNASLEPLLIRLSELLVEAHPDESNAYAISGDLYFQLGQNEKALRNYKLAVDGEKSNFGLWQNVLNIEMELEKYDSVAIVAESAIEYFPNQSAVYYYGGTAYLIQKKYKEAITMLEQGSKYTGTNPELTSVFYGQLGDAYNAISDHEKSDASYEKALQAQPDNDHVLNNFSYFLSLRKEQLPRAQEMSKKLVEKYPNNSTYLDTHAWVLYVMGNYKEARKYLELAIVDKDASGTIVEHYGDVLYKLKDINAAVEQWEKARKLGEASPNLDKKIADKKLYE